jgi:hypothetical protein
MKGIYIETEQATGSERGVNSMELINTLEYVSF